MGSFFVSSKLVETVSIFCRQKMAPNKVKLNSGESIPQLGLGTWLSKPGEIGQAIRDALHIGYR